MCNKVGVLFGKSFSKLERFELSLFFHPTHVLFSLRFCDNLPLAPHVERDVE
jgi:hypothetical protein